MNPEAALLVERHEADWMRRQAVVPGSELHQDPDITWLVQGGRVWGNSGILVRFSDGAAARRLDQIIARYREHGRGMGLWLAPAATPAHLPELLRARRFHRRKRFPAMLRDLERPAPGVPVIRGLEIRPVKDWDEFIETPHPSIGPLTTPLRKQAMAGLRMLTARYPRRVLAFVGWIDGEPAGASLLYLGKECAGLHDLTVRDELRGRGIGAALLAHTCNGAAGAGAERIALLATDDGERVCARGGFEEVARFDYWYRSFA